MNNLTKAEQAKLVSYAKELIAMRKAPKLQVYTSKDLIKIAKRANKAAEKGKLTTWQTVRAEFCRKYDISN